MAVAPRRRSRRWLALALAGAASLVALAWLGRQALAGGDEGEWAEVRRGPLEVAVEITGTLEASDSALLGPPQVDSGELKIAFMAPEGAVVEAGTPVLAFDTSQLVQQRERLLAERQQADSQLEKRRVELEKERQSLALQQAEAEARRRRLRLKVAVPEELVGAAELTKDRLDLELVEQEITSLAERRRLAERRAQAELAALQRRRDRTAGRVTELERQIERMTVAAPRPGTVTYVTDHSGEKRKVGDSVWRDVKVIEIPDLERMRGDGQVEEADIGRLAVGQAVSLRLDAHPDVEVRGQVASIGSTVRRTRRSRLKVASVEVELSDKDAERMRPGMRFRGRVITDRADDVLLLPLAAVTLTADGPRVYRRGLLGPEPVRPELGRASTTAVEVLGGLEAGDEVLLGSAGGAP